MLENVWKIKQLPEYNFYHLKNFADVQKTVLYIKKTLKKQYQIQFNTIVIVGVKLVTKKFDCNVKGELN